MTTQTFHSPGKLLLTGEYVVLDGAKALAIPTKYGQSMQVRVSTATSAILKWNSIDHQGNTWFQETFQIKDLNYEGTENSFSQTLQDILLTAKALNPNFLDSNLGYEITTVLDFPRDWGLGTSSTLIYNIASWAGIDAHLLLQKSFGGSGYDVAVAAHRTPILYELKQHLPIVTPVSLHWEFTEHLYFVHLNQKQDSKEGISRYKKAKSNNKIDLDSFSEITSDIITCTSLTEFSRLLSIHEARISEIIEIPTIKEKLFPDFKGTVKSLGAWGGDFVLVVAENGQALNYFKEKRFTTIIPFSDMIL
ncbi:MAG: GYDIA family GHMP kinase [Aureisphaera sp.]